MNSSLSPGTRLGRYEIRSKIGAGGMGEVYLAQDSKLDRKVALTILTVDVATRQDRMRRFSRRRSFSRFERSKDYDTVTASHDENGFFNLQTGQADHDNLLCERFH